MECQPDFNVLRRGGRAPSEPIMIRFRARNETPPVEEIPLQPYRRHPAPGNSMRHRGNRRAGGEFRSLWVVDVPLPNEQLEGVNVPIRPFLY